MRLYVRFSGKDESTAAEWLRGLIADGRYVEDVYVGG